MSRQSVYRRDESLNQLLCEKVFLVNKLKTRSLINLSDFKEIHTACICGCEVCYPCNTEINCAVVYCCCFRNVTAARCDCYFKTDFVIVALCLCNIVVSAFDVILKNKVTNKGKVLTQMSRFWFDYTKDVLPNHMLSVDTADMPEFFRTPAFEGRSMKCRKLAMLPIECIVRGYITGSGWASYQKTGKVCGIQLPEGLQESDKLPEPIYTPSTKAEIGDHDENISYEQSIDVLEKQFPGHGLEYATKLRDYTIALYKKCAEYALSRGIIIADTKFEFGLDEDGNVVLGDEMLTPDSSRFWPLEGYEPGHSQPSFDKQFVRDWLKANPDSNYDLPQDVIDKTIAKYLEAYELLTGKKL